MKRSTLTATAAIGLAMLAFPALADTNCNASNLTATQRLNCEQVAASGNYYYSAPAYTANQAYVVKTGPRSYKDERYAYDMRSGTYIDRDTRSSEFDTTGSQYNQTAAQDKYTRNDNPGEPRSARGSESAYNAPTKWGKSMGDKDVYSRDRRTDDRYYSDRDRYDERYVYPSAGGAYYYRDGVRYENSRDFRDSRSSQYDTTGSRYNQAAATDKYTRNDNPGEPRSARGSESAYNAPTKWGSSIGDKDVYSDNRYSYPTNERRNYYRNYSY